ncbi:hypothetical protein TOPH_01051 [Tolypocladium ophioglossoides CBS 100239]|uniref:Uncharacterized protein n=1 Tax=Tolypocladium ophioglossoides (strain CBS 100239) TaxID=1163406 RepID=A0A0L0NJM2_TOLOC|nr:hypothetical protein TOPH_01051 [Tolypocladium ophioglossoides CBS 100239]
MSSSASSTPARKPPSSSAAAQKQQQQRQRYAAAADDDGFTPEMRDRQARGKDPYKDDGSDLDDFDEDEQEVGSDGVVRRRMRVGQGLKTEPFEDRERRGFALSVLDKPAQLMTYAQSTSDVRLLLSSAPFPRPRSPLPQRPTGRTVLTRRTEHPQPAPPLQRHARRLRAPALVGRRRRGQRRQRRQRQRQEAPRRPARQGEEAAGEAGGEGGVGGLRGRASRDAAWAATATEDVRIAWEWEYGQGTAMPRSNELASSFVHLQKR